MALPPSNKAQEYVQQVCAQIRWKKAHPVVEEELLAHIEDQREAFLAEGMSAEEAEARAVAEMGSPLETGSQFDRIYRPKMEWSIVLLVGVMLILGTVLRGRLLTAMGTGYAITDLWSIPIGLVFMMLGYWLDYTALLAGGNKRANRTAILYFCIVLGIAYGLNSYYDSARVERFLGYMALFCPLLFCSGLYVRQKTGRDKMYLCGRYWSNSKITAHQYRRYVVFSDQKSCFGRSDISGAGIVYGNSAKAKGRRR